MNANEKEQENLSGTEGAQSACYRERFSGIFGLASLFRPIPLLLCVLCVLCGELCGGEICVYFTPAGKSNTGSTSTGMS